MILLDEILKIIEDNYCTFKLKCLFTPKDFEDIIIDILIGKKIKEVLYIEAVFKNRYCIELSNSDGYIILKIYPHKSINEYNTFNYLIDIEKNKILAF